MNIEELAKLVGQRARWTIFDLDVPVEVTDARSIFGRIDIRIKPVGGSGEHWCSSRAVVFHDERS